MDSFYDQPRCAPIPASIDQILSSRVPEVSLLVQPDINSSTEKKLSPTKNKVSYNVWKTQNQTRLAKAPKARHNKENTILSNECEYGNQHISKVMSRKHVRFNSPQIQKQALRLSNNTYINGSVENIKSIEEEYTNNNERNKSTFNKPFEQIYMANIPNRQLDVSIVEPCNHTGKKSIADSGKQENCDKLTNMLFFNKSDNKHSDYRNCEEVCGSPKNFCSSYLPDLQKPRYYPLQEHNNQLQPTNYKRQDSSNDPTVQDLLKVVQQQNEQILLLQKQVSLLLQNQSNQKQIEGHALKERPSPLQDSIRSTVEESPKHDQYYNPKETLSKFAIDVMTSFEVSIRSPNIPHDNLINECSIAPKIQEITNMDENKFDKEKNNSNNVDSNIKNRCNVEDEEKQSTNLSLILDEPIEIVERCPSPVNSIHVDMKDYSSDDDDSTGSSTDIGWTVYSNIMGQVNNLLRKANTDLKDIGSSSNSNIIADKTLKKVKEATLRHLKSIGVSLPAIEKSDKSQRSNETVNGSKYTPTEVSFAVKQLLMKYLPDDQLAKITHTPKHIPKENVKCNTENLIKRRPDFSFATVQYMKKYNLLTSDTIYQDPQQATKNTEVLKILDVTSLKQQPKLL